MDFIIIGFIILLDNRNLYFEGRHALTRYGDFVSLSSTSIGNLTTQLNKNTTNISILYCTIFV